MSAPIRRTRAEVQQLVAEFVSSVCEGASFARVRDLSFSTLDRHRKKLRWNRSPCHAMAEVDFSLTWRSVWNPMEHRRRFLHQHRQFHRELRPNALLDVFDGAPLLE